MGDHIFCYYFKLFQVSIFLTVTTTTIEIQKIEKIEIYRKNSGQQSCWKLASPVGEATKQAAAIKNFSWFTNTACS